MTEKDLEVASEAFGPASGDLEAPSGVITEDSTWLVSRGGAPTS